ncbi:MAG: hypothetical protein ABNH53_04310 [Henriciella sp.]|jgi:hypothetical protein
MKLTKTILIGAAAAALLPMTAFADGDGSSWDGQVAGERYSAAGSATAERILTDEEIREIIASSGANGANTDVRYMGGSQTAVESEYCCGGTEEQMETRTEVQETTEYIDAVTRREIIQPVQRTLIQPITREVLEGRDESITEDMTYITNRLPTRYERDDTPAVVENYIPQVTTNNTEEITETTYDVVARRDIIQPIERTMVVPVQRRITRPRVETITAETRYETRTAPTERNTIVVPETVENLTEDLTTVTEEQYSERVVPYVATRNIYQPSTVTTIQPIERQILRGTTETITQDTRYEEERLPLRVETEEAPQLVENVIPQVTERTILEVEDVYIDQITRNIIQPVVITTVQPVINEVLQGRTETETRETRYETETLPGRTESVTVPQTVVNYIPSVEEVYQEERSETYFDAVTQRDIYQPVVRTIIQPIEYRRVNARTETVTNPTRYETVRASLVVLNLGAPCNCN